MSQRSEVGAAMRRLLALADADVSSVWSGPGGARVHHLEAGQGEAVVLVHGGTGGGANWFRLIGPLSRSFRVLAPDLPGFGLSDPLPLRRPLGVVAADWLVGWMEMQGVTGALVAGTSFGGLAALRLAQRSPAVSRLLLLDAAGLGRGLHRSVRIVALPGVSRLAMRPSRSGTVRTLRRLLTTDRSDLPVEHEARLGDFLYASARAAGSAWLAHTLRLFAGPRGQREVVSTDELMSLRQPVSIVWGERDRLLPVSHARRAADWIPHAVLHVIAGSGHSPNWERPAAVVDAIERLHGRAAPRLPDRAVH